MEKKKSKTKHEIKTIEDFKKYSQMLAASRMLKEYLELQQVLIEIKDNTTCKYSTVEPEAYSTGWLNYNICGADSQWLEATSGYFIEMLYGYTKKNTLDKGNQNEQ